MYGTQDRTPQLRRDLAGAEAEVERYRVLYPHAEAERAKWAAKGVRGDDGPHPWLGTLLGRVARLRQQLGVPE